MVFELTHGTAFESHISYAQHISSCHHNDTKREREQERRRRDEVKSQYKCDSKCTRTSSLLSHGTQRIVVANHFTIYSRMYSEAPNQFGWLIYIFANGQCIHGRVNKCADYLDRTAAFCLCTFWFLFRIYFCLGSPV